MNEIILASERYAVTGALRNLRTTRFQGTGCVDSSIAKAAVEAAHERGCSAILVLTQRGALPPLVSAFRPSVPIFTFCPNPKVARQLQIYRGIHPIIDSSLDVGGSAKGPAQAINEAKEMGYIQAGDEVVVVFMEGDDANLKISAVH